MSSFSEAPCTYPASKKTDEEGIVVFLNICSANIADHVIDADICHEAFAYFLDEVEIIIEVLDDDSVPIEETCIESEEEKNGRI